MRLRIVVANQAEAAFYDVDSMVSTPRLRNRLTDPLAHLHDRDFKSDRPGRFSDHAARPGARRGASAHHGTGGERRPRKHEAELFARRVAEQIEQGRDQGEFDRLVLMAAPGFLGLLRKAMPSGVRSQVTAEVGKDLVHEPPRTIRAHVPEEAFRELPAAS
jgi:protein required for attachment to host cells